MSNKFNFNNVSKNVFDKKISPIKEIKSTKNEKNIKGRFDKTIEEIRNKFKLVNSVNIESNLKENLLRGQILFVFGTLDLYIHDILVESYLKIASSQVNFSRENIFSMVANEMNLTNAKLSKKLDEYYNRRNEIAHQFDFKGSTQNSIDEPYVKELIDFYKEFVDKLHNIIVNLNI